MLSSRHKRIAILAVGMSLVAGCTGFTLDPDAWRFDAAQHTPIATSKREPTCPAQPQAAAMAFAAPQRIAPRGARLAGGPLGAFFIPRPATAAGFRPAVAMAVPGAPGVTTQAALADNIDANTNDVEGALTRLPPKLQGNKVFRSVLNVATTRKLQMMRSVIDKSSEPALQAHFTGPEPRLAAALGPAAPSKSDLLAATDGALARHVPETVSIADIKSLHQALVSQEADRGLQYAYYYFSGKMVDRFGAKVAAPTFTDQKITNADITGLIVTLLESVADDALQTPVWVGADGKTFFPGASTSVPSALSYSALIANGDDTKVGTAPILEKMAAPDYGCGMTTLKAQALTLLANNAATWGKGGTGLVVGLFGGANLGTPFALGKVSVGDNQTLQAIVQSLIVFAAKRGVYEAAWPSFYGYEQGQHDSLATLVSLLKIISPADSDSSSGGSSKSK
jgi:hypothetical protein